MKTYRERINDCNTHIINDYYVLESDVNNVIDEIETEVNDIVSAIVEYDTETVLRKLAELEARLY